MLKTLFAILALGLCVASAADNDGAVLRYGSSETQVKVKSTDVGGVLTPHFILDSGGTGGDASASNQALQITQETAISGKLPATLGIKTSALSLSIAPSSDGVFPVTGTFWQATQPVSAASLPLPSGAATETTLAAQSAKLPATLGIKTSALSLSIAPSSDGVFPVTGTFWQATQPVSGAFFQATQPVSGTFWQATQPVSGTVTANVGTIGTIATEATLAAESAKLPAALGGTTSSASLSVVRATDQVMGFSPIVQASFTRPSDTTAYAALDAVSDSTSAPTVLTFTAMARSSGGSGRITRARIETDQSANVAAFKLHIFNVSPTAINDNAAFTKLWASRASYIGSITFPLMSTEGTGSTGAYAEVSLNPIQFVTSGSQNLFGILETLTAFTPANGQNFFVELTPEQN